MYNTNPSIIPEPDFNEDYTPEDYAQATKRVHQERERLLKNPRALAAYEALGKEIEAKISRDTK